MTAARTTGSAAVCKEKVKFPNNEEEARSPPFPISADIAISDALPLNLLKPHPSIERMTKLETPKTEPIKTRRFISASVV